MAQVFVTCELADLTEVSGELICSSGWQFSEVQFPWVDLTSAELAIFMSAFAGFLVLMAVIGDIRRAQLRSTD